MPKSKVRANKKAKPKAKSKLRNMHQYWDKKTNQFSYTFQEHFDTIFEVSESSGQYYDGECQDYANLTLELIPNGCDYQFYINWNDCNQHWFTLRIRHPGSAEETFTITIDNGSFNCS